MELLGALPLAHGSRYGSCLDDLNAGKPYAVSRGHLIVHLFHCTVQGGITELLVHVVIPSSTLISQPYAIVLDCGRVLLKDLQMNIKP